MSKIEVNAIEPQCGTDLTVGASGDTITFPTGTTIVNNGTQTGFGRTGTVDWDTTPKTATFSAVNGNGYFVNTTAGAITANLPAGTAGDIVAFADYAATWDSNNVTITPNGTDKIGSLNENATLNVEGQSVTFVYVDSTQGWINTMDSTSNVRGAGFICASVSGACNTLVTAPCCANVKIATFTGPGDFTVNSISSNAANNEISYMVLAGGAGAGGSATGYYSGGGGGAGGFREDKSPITPYTASPLEGAGPITVSATAYPIAIGAGGPGGPGSPSAGGPGCRGNGTDGNPTTALGITSTGGGGGLKSGANPGAYSFAGFPGGSGGGGGGYNSSPTAGAGSGNTPPVSPAQGNPGGSGSGPSAGYGGGGGGAGGVGQSAPTVPAHAAVGGPGVATSITASSVTYARGGAGGKPSGNCTGAPNTGNGGQGGEDGGSANGANGGSGIVIIRYKFQ